MANTIVGHLLIAIVFITVFGTCFGNKKNGFLLTMPQTLRYGGMSEFCLTMHDTKQEDTAHRVTLTFFHKESGLESLKVEELFPPGVQTCIPFDVPPPGEYDLLLSNSTDILHDVKQITVLDNKLITLVQTDKPMYKPGQMVKFRILTILSDMKPRVGQIKSVYITDPDDSRVKQYLAEDSQGITSLEFQLGKEAKLGKWTILVNVDEGEERDGRGTKTTFKVKEYVLPRFEVEVEPPAYILSTDETVSGKVCGKYTYGKPVKGYLSLDVCWTSPYGPPPLPCHHQVVEIDGCYNFTVNMADIRLTQVNHYFMAPSQLEVRAKVTEHGTGAEVSYNHTGPGLTNSPLKVDLDDFTNGYFKPGLPYFGKVKVTRPDGSPAPGELIQVIANDFGNSLRFARNFTTDETGLILFAFCGELKEETSTISINAEAVEYTDSINPTGMYRPSGHRSVVQWFSPSLSYLQLPRPESAQRCGDRLTLNVPYTTREGVTTEFNYQVMARGKIVKTGRVEQDGSMSPGMGAATPSASMCLQAQVVDEPSTHDGGYVPGAVPPDLPFMPREDFPIAVDDQVLPDPPRPDNSYQEPIVRSEQVSDTVSNFLLEFSVEPVMSPKFTLLVYHVMQDGEVVADSMQFDVESCFENAVKMEFSESQTMPGKDVTVRLDAAPGSLCGVGVVDKSVNILGGDHQITPAKVFEEIGEFSIAQHPMYGNDYVYCEERLKNADLPESDDSYWQYSSPYVDASKAFQRSGMLVLTDLTVETRPCGRAPPVFYDFALPRNSMPGPVPISVDNDRRNGGPLLGPVGAIPEVAKATPAPSVRSHFPETWLWDILPVGPSGRADINKTSPHTVTTWNGNAMCINGDQGFGLSEMTSLTTFQPFFLSVHMPYAAFRSERLPLIVTVYNYLEKCITVKLNLEMEPADAYKIHNSRQYRNPICVCGGESYSAKYYVTPTQIGTHKVISTATIVSGRCRKSVDIDLNYVGLADQVHRKMLVKPEGVEQSYTHSSYMCSKDGDPLNEQVILMLPDQKDMVKHSARGEVQVIGDIMGPALSNLDHLVRMPTGCGEQNMVGFVPNILVLDYLTAIGNLGEKTEKAAKKNMEAGYQRELNYRHDDGSFSAFGKNDPAGSVWLTAFVVKSFAQAQKYIFIDEKDLQRSVDFLRRSQLETGCFRETGKVFSSYMMGGMSNSKGRKRETLAPLTAYVLVSLLQAGVNTSEPVIRLGLRCMNRDLKSRNRKLDTYSLAMLAYANTLHDPDSEASLMAIKALAAEAKKEGPSMYWSRGSLQPPARNTWFYTAAPSAEVEMTSYALMAYLMFHKDEGVEATHNVAMWLTRQRNPSGGFASTQDTVVGLDALSKFAARAYSGEPTELQVNLQTAPQGRSAGLDQVFNVSDGPQGTRFLLQSAPIPALPTTLNISTRGGGCALVQANVVYNKPPKAYMSGTKPEFFLKVRVGPVKRGRDRCDRRSITISVSARRGHKFSKGMGLISMQMVTSWSPVADSITNLESQFPRLGMKRIEYDEEEAALTFYFDEFTRKAKHFTLDVQQDKDLKVSRPKPAEVKVFEYYDKDVTNVQMYRIKTTCGTKAEIPRGRPPPIPGDFPVQFRVEASLPRRVANAPPASSSRRGCPVCHKAAALPDDFESIVCNATVVYKALSGRKGAMPIKIRQDIRPKVKQSMSRFASPDMNPDCSCSLLSTEGGQKRVLIISSKRVSDKSLSLDSNSMILKTSRRVEQATRAAVQKCSPGM